MKNAGGQLPLDAARAASIAVIGSHADVGVLSGGGSDQVDPAGGNAVAGTGRGLAPFLAAEGDPRQGGPTRRWRTTPARTRSQRHDWPSASDVAIVFVHQHTSEGSDVPNLSLPGKQDALVSAVAAANPHTIVVLETGGPVTMPWIDKVERGDRGLVSGHSRRRGDRRRPLRRREPVGQAAGHVPQERRPTCPR